MLAHTNGDELIKLAEQQELRKEVQNKDTQQKQYSSKTNLTKQNQKQNQEQEQALSNEVVSDRIVDFLSSILWSREDMYALARRGALKIALQENCTQAMGVEIVKKEILGVAIKQCTKADSELKKNVAEIPSEIFDGPVNEATMSAASILVLKQLQPEIQEAAIAAADAVNALELEKISKQDEDDKSDFRDFWNMDNEAVASQAIREMVADPRTEAAFRDFNSNTKSFSYYVKYKRE